MKTKEKILVTAFFSLIFLPSFVILELSGLSTNESRLSLGMILVYFLAMVWRENSGGQKW